MTRIGLAVGESEVKISSARTSILASKNLKKDAFAIVELARKESCDLIAIGFPEAENPLDDGKMQRICRLLAEKISEKGVKAILIDESLTTVEAEASLRDAGLSASTIRKYKDGRSAQIILERFFEGGFENL